MSMINTGRSRIGFMNAEENSSGEHGDGSRVLILRSNKLGLDALFYVYGP
ncbi:hypothetical protein V7654_06305 [Bacillus sp. JJ1609]